MVKFLFTIWHLTYCNPNNILRLNLVQLTHPGFQDARKDLLFAAILQFREGKVVEMTSETCCNWVTTTTWWAHGTHKVHINQSSEIAWSQSITQIFTI